MSTTDRFRRIARWLFVLTILVALGGWLIYDRDPGALGGILTAVVTAAGIGEMANIGKRATYKREAVE